MARNRGTAHPEPLSRGLVKGGQQHLRPFELLLLAGGMWWSLNRSSRHEEITRLSSMDEMPEADSRWDVLMTLAKVLGATAGYLLIVVTTLSLLEPQGLGWTLATAGAGMVVGTAAFLLAKRAGQHRFTTVFDSNDTTSRS